MPLTDSEVTYASERDLAKDIHGAIIGTDSIVSVADIPNDEAESIWYSQVDVSNCFEIYVENRCNFNINVVLGGADQAEAEALENDGKFHTVLASVGTDPDFTTLRGFPYKVAGITYIYLHTNADNPNLGTVKVIKTA